MRALRDREGRTGVAIAWLGFGTAAAIALGIVSPATAALAQSGAEKLHRLDVMLKASEDRCARRGVDLRAEYGAFANSQRYALDRAKRELWTQFAQRYGPGGARDELARMDALMEREYSGEHPWLTCRDIKAIAHGLAQVEGSATLLEAADQVLPRGRGARMALSRS